jgi:hypothetical protein
MSATGQPLSVEEAERLHQCRTVVKTSVRRSYVEVGAALTEIRDRKLYRQDYATFETCCQAEFSMSRPQAYRLIDAFHVASNLSPMGDILSSPEDLAPLFDNGDIPHSERVARSLTKLDPEQQRDAWNLARAASENPTAAQVEQAAKAFQGKNSQGTQRHTIKLFEGTVEMSLLDKLFDLGFNYASEASEAIEERAATSQERAAALAFLFNDFERITESIRAHFAPNPETDPDETEPASPKETS